MDMCLMMRTRRSRRKRVRKEKLCEFALAERDKGRLEMSVGPASRKSVEWTDLVSFVVIALHLQTLSKVHQTFIDLPSLCKRGSGCLCSPCTFRTCLW